MVSLKGKSRVDSTRVSVGGQSRPSVGGRNFKIYSGTDRIKVGEGLMTSTGEARETGATSRRSAIVASRGAIPNSTSNPNPKGGFKTMEKSSGKYGTSANTTVRKALADLSNVQGDSATAIRRNSSKTKVSAGSSTKVVSVSLRKSITGRVQSNTTRQNGVQLHAPNKGTDLKASLDDQKNETSGGQSGATKDRFGRKPILPKTTSTSRMSLPVPKRVNRADMSNTKENAGSSETANGQSGLPAKATTGVRVSSQLNNARSHLWKTRVSDGFVQMVQSNVLQASSRKSIKPIVKTTVKASAARRTLKSKSISCQSKSKSTAAVSSKDEETASLSLPENGSAKVSDDANQRHLQCVGEGNLITSSSEFLPRKKSTRRKSYTTSLIERSKFLKESGEVKEQDNLPNIDNECNQLEVSEYIDDIYQYYWVTEAYSPTLANYMSIQTDITPQMRGILVNWLIEVHFKYDLMPETLYLTITLLDQYLSQVTIKKIDMQLVGLTTLLLASKYEDFWHPRVKDLLSISGESYTRDQMLGMEKLVLRKLNFRLNCPTPYVFLVRFLKAAQTVDKKLEHMAFFLIELCLVEYEALAFKPSLLCASALYVARCTLQITPPWTPLLRKHTRYEASQIRGCADMILRFHKAAGVGKLTVTYEKYSRQEFSGVAAVKPLDRLPLPL
ncbi:putative cyclin-B3-1 isoform X2 [Lotus japonicus]|uniref:putative cyclin-B3-1 isoform X2 n=1 Tax=Lotus japonicus TaxID=34305 RepID=UPI0025867B09|nr:putative cyclin-B3-1 isoform X2 [Lotus japonicus]